MSGLDNLKKRVSYYGETVDDREVKDKLNSFHCALKDSYQAEWITFNENRYRCLINPSRLTEEFDKKVLSIDYDAGIKEGDVFYWDRTKMYWLVDLQQHTEEAYFRGTISRCDSEIEIEGKRYWCVKRGPVETTTQWNQKHQLYFNELNASILLQVKKDSRTVKYFSRHNVVPIKMSYVDADSGEELFETHNWKVVATDKYSSDNIIEVYLKEDYDNEMAAAQVDPQPQEPEVPSGLPQITGPSIINGYDSGILYEVKNITNGTFVFDNDKIKITNMTDTSVTIDVMTGKAISNVRLEYRDSLGNVKVYYNIRVKSI